MRTLLLASAAVLAIGGTGWAQTFSGTAPGNPRSTAASNITASDTRSHLAPALPSPGYDLTAQELLMKAQQAVKSGRTGLAQQALEQAETRLLTRSVPQGQGNMPDTGPRVDDIRNARVALSKGDRAAVLQNIQMAMAEHGGGTMGGTMGNTMGAGGSPMPANGMNNNPAGLSGGGGNQSAGPAGASPMAPMPAGTAGTGLPANGMNNNPAGLSGGGGNQSSGPAQ